MDKESKIITTIVTLAILSVTFSFVYHLRGQTSTSPAQSKLQISPITSVERSKCVGSGTGTGKNQDGTTFTYTWDCDGLQLFRMTLADGTKIGPFMAIRVSPEDVMADPKWQSIPLAHP